LDEARDLGRDLPVRRLYLEVYIITHRRPFQESFKKFVTAQRFLPIAEYITGDFSGKLNINSELDDKLMPVWNSFFSQGALSVPKAKVQDYPPMNKVSEVLKISQLHNPALSNLTPSYVIKNGRFFLEPMTFQVEQYQITAGGSTGLDKSLDYALKVLIPAKEMNQQANSYMSQLLKKDLTVLTNETVAVDLSLKGTVKDPKVQVMGSDVIKGVTDPLQAAAMQEMEKQKAEMERQAQEALDKQKQELEKQKKEAEKKLKDKLKDLFKK